MRLTKCLVSVTTKLLAACGKKKKCKRNVVALLDTASCRRNMILKQGPDNDWPANDSVLVLSNANYNDSDIVPAELSDCLVGELVAGSLAPKLQCPFLVPFGCYRLVL